MKNKAFIQAVLNSNSRLDCVDGYFYLKPLEHILSGFCCESVSDGIYIWKFRFPLFVLSDAIHLSYSVRLRYPDGFISKEITPKAEYAKEFLKRIEPHMQEANDTRTIEGYIKYNAEKTLDEFGYKFRKSYAYALILAGEFGEAIKIISEIVAHLKSRNIDHACIKECENFIYLLNSDGQAAVQLLMEWRLKMENKLFLVN